MTNYIPEQHLSKIEISDILKQIGFKRVDAFSSNLPESYNKNKYDTLYKASSPITLIINEIILYDITTIITTGAFPADLDFYDINDVLVARIKDDVIYRIHKI